MGSHAILSPSSASRWMACTPSARLEADEANVDTDASREGTLAHALAELKLRRDLGLINNHVFKKLRKALVESPEGMRFYCEAMDEHTDNYVAFVMERYTEARTRNTDAIIRIEERLDLSDYVPEGFGTGDAGILSDEVLDVIDLKYGKGVKVAADENKQMKTYALGWLEALGALFDIKTVRMTIYQPRIDNIETFEMGVEELERWGAEELRPKAELAFKGDGEFVPGTHCQFCKVRVKCKALADRNLALLQHDFKDAAFLTDEETVDILKITKQVEGWLTSVNEYALAQALAGRKWPGMKLVEGRSVRVISDKDTATNKLAAAVPAEMYLKPAELLGVTTLEKNLGKAAFTELVGPYVSKPPGKPTLTTADDKRPEFNPTETLAKEFAEN